MNTLPVALVILRLPPLLHLLALHPPSRWPLAGLALLATSMLAIGGALGFACGLLRHRAWCLLEALALSASALVALLGLDAVHPGGGCAHALAMALAACLCPQARRSFSA